MSSVEVLDAEIVNSAPFIEGLDNSVGGAIEVYTPPVQPAPAAKPSNNVPSPERDLANTLDSRGRPLGFIDDAGNFQWNRSFEFDDIPDYGTPDFNDWANGADLDPEAFDNFVGRNRGRAGARALDALDKAGIVADIAYGIAGTPGRYAEGRALFQDLLPNVPGAGVLGGFLGAFAPTYPLVGALGVLTPQSQDGLPIMAPGRPSFQGGMCPGVVYNAFFDYTLRDGRSGSNGPLTGGHGPVLGIRREPSNPGIRLIITYSSRSGGIEVKYGSGYGSISNVRFEPRDGPIPSCGGGPGVLEPQSPGAPTISIDLDGDGIPDLDIPIPVPGVDGPPGIPAIDGPPANTQTGDPPIQPIRPTLPEIPRIPEIPDPETEEPPAEESPPGQDGPPGGEGDCCDRTTQNLSALREKLDQILRLFEETGTEAIDLAPCGSEQSQEDEWAGAGFHGVYRGLETLSRAVEDIWTQIRCGEDAIAIPEWWAVRPGADVPQLAITFKAEQGSSYWSLTIPHYHKPATVVPQVPRYEKGSIFATLTLKDNTKLTVNAKTFEEGERVLYALVGYIDPAYLPNPLNIHQGRRKGAALKEVTVVPTKGYFYATGQQDARPDWVTDIEVI